MTLPSGRVLFLFTDLEGSTRAWENAPELVNTSLRRHDELVRDAIESHGGFVFAEGGDAFAAAFHGADEGVAAAVAIQHALNRTQWPDQWHPRIRVGLHLGEAYERDHNYYGPVVNRAARIMASAHGGQIVVSDEVVAEVAENSSGLQFRRLGTFYLKDVADAVVLSQVVCDGLESDFPPLNTLDRFTSKLPRPRTSLVGRDAELAEILSRVRPGQLVTLFASAGTGKTRLAQEVALRSITEYDDGVFFVELDDIASDEVVARLGATVLDDAPLARAVVPHDLLMSVAAYLATRRALVVLDNCEHVRDTVVDVITVLQRHCPQISLLTTSRERLRFPGEVAMTLSTLEVAANQNQPRVSLAASLFLDRALAVVSNFQPTEETLRAIEAICTEVDGLPLAIELAAARVRTISPERILERLGQSLAVLRDAGAIEVRHQSLEGALAWSFDLLDDVERRVLAWTAVFVGGFSLVAFEALIDECVGDEDPLDLLESLCDKSLLTPIRHGVDVRYRLANPVRHFALQVLEQLGERTHVEDRHSAYFTKVARQASAQVSRGFVDPMTDLRAEHDNFVAAIQRTHARGDSERALLMTLGLHAFWEETGNLVEACERIDGFMSDHLDEEYLFRAQCALVAYAPMCGNVTRAHSVAEQLEPSLQLTLAPKDAARLRFTLGFEASARGDMTRASNLWCDAAERVIDLDRDFARQSLLNAADSEIHSGNFDRAHELIDRAESLEPPVQYWWSPMVQTRRGLLQILSGNGPEEGLTVLETGAREVAAQDLQFRTILAALNAGVGTFIAGQVEVADEWARRLITVGLRMGHVWATWFGVELGAWVATAQHQVLEAGLRFAAADRVVSESGYGRWPLMISVGEEQRRRAVTFDAEHFALGTAEGNARSLQGVAEHVLATSSKGES